MASIKASVFQSFTQDVVLTDDKKAAITKIVDCIRTRVQMAKIDFWLPLKIHVKSKESVTDAKKRPGVPTL